MWTAGEEPLELEQRDVERVIGPPGWLVSGTRADGIVRVANHGTVHRGPADDPLQRCPDISLARETLNWEPKVALDQGLTKTVAYFDGLLRGNMQVSRIDRAPAARLPPVTKERKSPIVPRQLAAGR